MLTVESIDQPGDLATFAGQWSGLVERADGDLFQTPEWITTWLEVFWRDRPLAFVVLRQGGEWAGLAPFLRDRDGTLWCAGTLVPPIHPHVRGTDLLASIDRHTVVEEVISYLHRGNGRPKLALHVRGDSPTLAALPRVTAAEGMCSLVRPESSSPWVRLGPTWKGYLDSRTRHVRRELNRKMRRLEKTEHLEWSVIEGPRSLDAAIADVLHVDARSWKVQRGESIAGHPSLEAFYSQLASICAARGWLRLHLMHVNGEAIAYIYGVVHRNRYYALKTSYDQEFRALSPGIALFGHALRDAVEQGYDSFEFLGEEARWKLELATGSRPYVYVCVVPARDLRCRSCHFIHTRLKPTIKRRFPSVVRWDRARRCQPTF